MAAGQSRQLDYRDLKELMRKNAILLIDVREPSETKQGAIPGSVNIPLQQLKEALDESSSNEFKRKYGFPKPNKQAPLVFSCRGGVRSQKALQVALGLGYEKSRQYAGGYQDWQKNSGR